MLVFWSKNQSKNFDQKSSRMKFILDIAGYQSITNRFGRQAEVFGISNFQWNQIGQTSSTGLRAIFQMLALKLYILIKHLCKRA